MTTNIQMIRRFAADSMFVKIPEEFMDSDDRKLSQIRKLLQEAEEKIQAAKRVLFEQVYQEKAEKLEICQRGPNIIVEGIFNGEEMMDKTGKKYAVPANYCSKSKLVSGDSLKLTIASDGSYIFKQIGPVDRKRLTGKITKKGDEWQISAEGKKYRCLQAAATYFKAKVGDKITIILPRTGESEWAAIENILEKGGE